jgi:hypothetical protein
MLIVEFGSLSLGRVISRTRVLFARALSIQLAMARTLPFCVASSRHSRDDQCCIVGHF